MCSSFEPGPVFSGHWTDAHACAQRSYAPRRLPWALNFFVRVHVSRKPLTRSTVQRNVLGALYIVLGGENVRRRRRHGGHRRGGRALLGTRRRSGSRSSIFLAVANARAHTVCSRSWVPSSTPRARVRALRGRRALGGGRRGSRRRAAAACIGNVARTPPSRARRRELCMLLSSVVVGGRVVDTTSGCKCR